MHTDKRHRFPPDIISCAVWLYYRLSLSHRDIEGHLAERGIAVSIEAIRLWCIKFGALSAMRLKSKHRGYGNTFYIDEIFVKINGKQHYLCGQRPRWLSGECIRSGKLEWCHPPGIDTGVSHAGNCWSQI